MNQKYFVLSFVLLFSTQLYNGLIIQETLMFAEQLQYASYRYSKYMYTKYTWLHIAWITSFNSYSALGGGGGQQEIWKTAYFIDRQNFPTSVLHKACSVCSGSTLCFRRCLHGQQRRRQPSLPLHCRSPVVSSLTSFTSTYKICINTHT